MTLGGVASATLVMFAFLLVGAWYGWTLVTETPVLEPAARASRPRPPRIDSPLIVFGALIGAFILAMVSVFKPKLARFTGVLYAVLEGVFLGAISHLYNAQFDGIVAQAILATFGVFLAMLVLYGLRILRATPRFVKGVIGATFGIMFLYLGSAIFSLFSGNSPSFLTSSSPLSIGISVVIVIVAALNLILDFDFIEKGSAARPAGLHGLVRGARADAHPGVALPGDAAPAVQAPPVSPASPTGRWAGQLPLVLQCHGSDGRL